MTKRGEELAEAFTGLLKALQGLIRTFSKWGQPSKFLLFVMLTAGVVAFVIVRKERVEFLWVLGAWILGVLGFLILRWANQKDES